MKPIFYLWVFLVGISQNLIAQYSIYGHIADEHDSDVPFANVMLLNQADSVLVKGAVADQNGNYKIVDVSKGYYIIKTQMVGFSKTFTRPFIIDKKPELHMEDIILLEDATELDEVVIEADKPLYEMQMGKMVVNVTNNVSAAGQSAIDILEKSPGVLVNRQNTTFSLNGKNGVIVLMNGKRSRMPLEAVYQMLESINAGDIEKIEIMTVPPAKYDADGDAGFINIVTKKGTGLGTTGSFSLNGGYGSGPRGGGGLNLSHISKNISVYGSYSANYREQIHDWNNFRTTTDEDFSTDSGSEADRNTDRFSHNYQLGVDFQLGKKTILGALVSGYLNRFHMESVTNSLYHFSAAPDTIIKLDTEETNRWQHLMGNLNLVHTFDKGQKININFDYLTYDNSNPSNYDSDYLNGNDVPIKNEKSRISKLTPLNIIVGKIDYSMNLGKIISWDSGIKGTFSKLDNNVLFEELKNDDWNRNDLISTDASLEEDILAAFTTFNFKLPDGLTINTGVRYEYTTTYLSTPEEKGVVDRKYGNFFPTMFISKKINNNNLVQLSFGKRITRPSFNEMAPFVIFFDPFTYFSGNENILPTFTYNVKGDYSYKSFTFSLQYSNDKNAIARFQPIIDPETNVMTLSSDNIDRMETISTNITIPVQVTDWWEMQNNLSGNWQKISNDVGEYKMERSLYGYQLNSTQTFKLPHKITIELSGYYNSPVINGYFNWLARGFVNLGVQKVFKNEGALRLACNDIFETTQFRWRSENQNDFNFYGNIKFDKRIFVISYSQRFGNKKAKKIRNRSVGSSEEMRRVTN